MSHETGGFGEVAADATGEMQDSAKGKLRRKLSAEKGRPGMKRPQVQAVRVKNKSATNTAKILGAGHGAFQKLKSTCQEQIDLLPALGRIDEVLGLTAGALPQLPSQQFTARVGTPGRMLPPVIAERAPNRWKRPQQVVRSMKVATRVSKKLKLVRRGGIEDLPAGGDTDGAGSRERHVAVEAGFVQLGE